MAKRPLYDLLPRNSEIHNFTSVKLTEWQSRVLGMGLKFRPSLRPPSEAQFDLQIQDFCRRVRLQDKFANSPQDTDFNPRLYVPTGWNPPRENPDLEDKLYALRKELRKSIVVGKPHWRNNLAKQEREELLELKANPDIRVLPTDKNLGPALLSTDWVQAETLRLLNDEQSYRQVTQPDWYANRLNVICSRNKLMSIYSRFISSDVARFLCSFDHFASPAKFYVIPKIHKDPMVGRPIAASHSYITRPISIFIDELTKPNICMPTVLRDSGELIQILENTVLPKSNCFLVTADVVSLYPNVDTKKALVALDLLLREAKVAETPLLLQLARIVFNNNYLSSEFSPDIFHQVFGIAMGTPFAVTVANAFMYYHEKDIVEYYSQYLAVYKRFIDDVFAIWCGPKDILMEFLGALSNKTERIKLTYNISENIECQLICPGVYPKELTGDIIPHVIPKVVDPFYSDEEGGFDVFPKKQFWRPSDCNLLCSPNSDLCIVCMEYSHVSDLKAKAKQRRLSEPAHVKAPVSSTAPERLKLTLQMQRLKCSELEQQLEEMKQEITKSSVLVDH
ncbi:hypothetical protein ACROYT_G033325 [Oculina patagonica]